MNRITKKVDELDSSMNVFDGKNGRILFFPFVTIQMLAVPQTLFLIIMNRITKKVHELDSSMNLFAGKNGKIQFSPFATIQMLAIPQILLSLS